MTCALRYDGTVKEGHCNEQSDGLVTWIDCALPDRRQMRSVHGVRNVGTTWFRQFIVEFLVDW